jgi:hypothetical protein
MAMPPSVVAGTSASEPLNLPIGVRAAETRKTCPLSVTDQSYVRLVSEQPAARRPPPAAVAAQARMSRSKVGRIERGEYRAVPLVELVILAAVVGPRAGECPSNNAVVLG